jgi:hypothetical protein
LPRWCVSIKSTGRPSRHSKKEYELGQRSLTDFLNAQNQYFNAQISLTSWRSVVVFADYQLMAAMGTLLDYLTPPPPIDATPVDLVVFGWLPTYNAPTFRWTLRCSLRRYRRHRRLRRELPPRPPNPLSGLTRRDGGSESRADRGDGGVDRRRKRPTSTERKGHYGDDTSRNDKVFERHHAVLIRAKTLQGFRGLNIVLQHRRKSLFTR